jgi:hypothetical protein
MRKDPKQYTNLASDPNHAAVIARLRNKMKAKLAEIYTNDLGLKY